jgi:hypothetical protein
MSDSHQYLSYEEERGIDQEFEAHQDRLADEQDERDNGDELNVAMGASARRRAAREAGLHDGEYLVKWEINIDADSPREAAVKALEIQRNPESTATCFTVGDEFIDLFPDDGEDEEGPTYHGIVRYTHVRCGYTTRKRSEMEILNDLDPACPWCSEVCRMSANVEDHTDCTHPYGEIVWEQADGTMMLTVSELTPTSGGCFEVVRRQPVRTHVQVYKSWVNGPEWWVVPRPNTGDIDGSDNLIVGFDTYQQALTAVSDPVLGLHSTFNDLLGTPDGIAWRDRNDPIYQTTTPREGLRF